MDSVLLGQLAINGVLLGLIYGLVGVGLSLVLGVMGVLNISHGALYMFGGYLSFFFVQQLGFPPLAAVAAAVIGIFVIGVLIDGAMVRPTSNDPTSVMIMTFGLAIVLGQVALLAWGGNPIAPKPLVRGTVSFGAFYAQSQILLAAAIGIGAAGLTIVFLRKTKLGKAMRMVSQNREIASVVGVNSGRISAISFGLGSAYAGLAGVLLTPLYLDYPDAQWQPLVAAFVIVVVGGLGSVAGSMIGGLIYGLLQTIGSYFSPAGSDIIALVLVVLIIIVRPSGILGLRAQT